MEAIVIRPAKIEDLQAVQDLNHQLFLSDNRHLDDLNTDWPYQETGESYFRKRIMGDNGCCFVAEAEGQVVGYVAGGWSGLPAAAYKGKRAELENICVDEGVRSHGVGARLVERLYRWAKEQSADYVMVDVYTANVRAVSFYGKQGFEPYSTVLWHKL